MDKNSNDTKAEDIFAEGVEAFIPQLSINCVVFKYGHPNLKVLFHSLHGTDQWFLPGGFVKQDESLQEAAYRNLSYSGIEQVFLRQIHTFGETVRKFNFSPSEFSDNKSIRQYIDWASSKRFITVVYYGLVKEDTIVNTPNGIFQGFNWIDVDQLKNIAMDHANITLEAKKILSTEILNHPVASGLLQESFTLNELRGLFEAINNRKIDRGTFRRKMLKLGIVEQVDERKESVGRPAYLYRFNQKAYHRLLKEETKFGF